MSYNYKILDTIGLSLFFLNYGKDANLHLNLRVRLKAKRALVTISRMQVMYKEIATHIRDQNNKVAIYNHKKRKIRP